MRENLRSQYLKTLGIIEYLPKYWETDSEENQEIVTKIDQKNKNNDSAQSPQLTDFGVISNNETILENDLSDRLSIPMNELSVEVKLVVWRPVDEILVCGEVDAELPNSHQIELLTNVVAAIEGKKNRLPQFEILQWPPYNKVQGNKREAIEFISTFLSAKLETGIIKLVIILGDSAKDWILDSKQQADLSDGHLKIRGTIDLVIIPSLKSMIDEPVLKRNAWQTLKPYSKFSNI